MNFFGVGLPEVAVIIVVALIVLGPERLPEAAVQLAKAIKYLRGYATDTSSQLRSELGELTREYDAVRRELREFRESVTRDFSSITNEVSRTIEDSRPIGESRPIIEPGGDLPPEPNEPKGAPTP
jgi:sec-independent protein translocase protein TatB